MFRFSPGFGVAPNFPPLQFFKIQIFNFLQVLREVETAILDQQRDAIAYLTENALSKPYKKNLRDIMAKYEDFTKLDRAAEVNQQVEEARETMQNNMRTMLNNQASLQALDTKVGIFF